MKNNRMIEAFNKIIVVIISIMFIVSSVSFAEEGKFPLTITNYTLSIIDYPNAKEIFNDGLGPATVTATIMLDYALENYYTSDYFPTPYDDISYVGREGRTLYVAIGNRSTRDVILTWFIPDAEQETATFFYDKYSGLPDEAILLLMEKLCIDGYEKNDKDLAINLWEELAKAIIGSD